RVGLRSLLVGPLERQRACTRKRSVGLRSAVALGRSGARSPHITGFERTPQRPLTVPNPGVHASLDHLDRDVPVRDPGLPIPHHETMQRLRAFGLELHATCPYDHALARLDLRFAAPDLHAARAS